MSLKAFHIFFISLSTLLALGFAAWEVKGYVVSGEITQLVAGIISACVAVGLAVYGVRFVKKMKHVGLI